MVEKLVKWLLSKQRENGKKENYQKRRGNLEGGKGLESSPAVQNFLFDCFIS